jgi:adenosylhomocysteine nucleosidase
VLNLIAALDCEAKPLVARLRLHRRDDCRAFKVFEGDNLRLLISGTGKLAAATATAYAVQLSENSAASSGDAAMFLNFGVAGHASAPIGSTLVANAVLDAGSGQRWYPAQMFSLPCSTTSITTFDAPNFDYSQPGGYDMELSGMLSSAMYWTTIELVQSVKIVSDNRPRKNGLISADTASTLIEAGLPVIEHMITHLLAIQENNHVIDDLSWLQHLYSRFRFSTYQRLALRKLLKGIQLLDGGDQRIARIAGSSASSAQLLKMLRTELQQARLSFTE